MMKQLYLFLVLALGAGAAQAQAVQLKDIYPGEEDSSPRNFFVDGDRMFFRADSADANVELWITDGTSAGTQMVLDINPGDTTAAGNSNPDEFTSFNGEVFFKARNASNGLELWATDGTAAGTREIIDIQPGDGNGNPFGFGIYNDQLYFTANDGTNGGELWFSDGTAAGTRLAVDFQPGSGTGNPGFAVELDGKLILRANDGNTGNEIWVTDGTPEGTMLLADIREGSSSSSPTFLTPYNGEVYFRARSEEFGTELWKTDGTPEGTVQVADINPGSGNGSPDNLFVGAGLLFFEADDGTNGDELWVTDGTNTLLVEDLNVGSGSADPDNFLEIFPGELIVFTADDGELGEELWSMSIISNDLVNLEIELDLVADINTGAEDSSPEDLVWTGTTLYFSAETADFGRELYEGGVFDEEVMRVTDINPGAESSDIDDIILFNELLVFEATDGVTGDELWAYPAQTVKVEVTLESERLMSGDTIDFGSMFVGVDPLQTEILSFRNAGTGPIYIEDETTGNLMNPFGGAFDNAGDLDSLASGAATPITLGFFATESGIFFDDFFIVIPSVQGFDTLRFVVRGEGITPLAEINVGVMGVDLEEGALLDFGELLIGEDSTMTVTISNPGIVPLAIAAVQVSDDTHFSVDASGLVNMINPGLSTTFNLIYTPTQEGVHETSVMIVNNATEDNTFDLALRGSALMTSVNDFGIAAAKAFPNPTQDRFTLQLEEELTEAQFRIYDLSGKVVQQGVWPAGTRQHEFELSTLAAGIYQLELRNAQGRLVVEIVKQ
jgi:ELWxxDGT repeat protein